MVGQQGITKISPDAGDVPGELEVTYGDSGAVDLNLQLEYVGEETVDFLGRKTKKGDSVRFGYSRFVIPMSWSVKVFPWTEKTDPRTQTAAFASLIKGQPAFSKLVGALDFATSRSFLPGAPADKFATVAETTVTLPDGSYDLEVTMDDGARVWIDGKLVIDEWHYQGPTTYTAALRGGKHAIRIEHFEIDGYAALRAEIKKR
jgi:hypothetical protein